MSGTAPAKPQTLDDLMLAMDVVDTIRHRELVVERELTQGDRDAALRKRLREIYQTQGIEVSDATIDQGIKALKESRFVYTPPGPSLARSLAMLWIRRKPIIGWTSAILLTAGALSATHYYTITAPAERAKQETAIALADRLPAELKSAADAARNETVLPQVLNQIDALERDGKSAIVDQNVEQARTVIAALKTLREQLTLTYTLHVVARPEETTGLWRIPNINDNARNYYLIVEAISRNGATLRLPIKNEETGKTETVSKWGVRVPEAFFNAIRLDKKDNGIIEQNPIATKQRGELEPRYNFVKTGGNITEWGDE